MLAFRSFHKYLPWLMLAAVACDSANTSSPADDAGPDAADARSAHQGDGGAGATSDPTSSGEHGFDAGTTAGRDAGGGETTADRGDAARPIEAGSLPDWRDGGAPTSETRGSSATFPDAGLFSSDGGAPGVMLADDFDGETAENGEYTFKYAAFEQWSVIDGTVDVIVLPNQLLASPGGYGPGEAADGVTVDLNGSSLSPGTIETVRAFTFHAGAEYQLSYALGSPFEETNAARFEIEGVFSVEEEQHGILPFVRYSAAFTPEVTTTAKLRITSLGGPDNVGLFLDEVVLERLR